MQTDVKENTDAQMGPNMNTFAQQRESMLYTNALN